MNQKRYTIDTCAVISYFKSEFEGADSNLSQEAINLIDSAFNNSEIIIHFPSIIFLEIFSKWFKDEESASRIRSNVYYKISQQENFAIENIDQEVLENFIKITDIEHGWNFDNHDKQVLATAMKFKTPLITTDLRIIRYNKRKHVIPGIIS